MTIRSAIATAIATCCVASTAHGELLGEGPALGPPEQRISQSAIEAGGMSKLQLREAGLRLFSTRFNHFDGYGDGPLNPADTTTPGGRPMLGNNGTFLRVNGLDAQSCNACHGIVSSATTPPTLGVGGSGGLNNAVMFMPRTIDVADNAFNGRAEFDGRLIVPPALFGAGGLQLLGTEISAQLAALKAAALANPGEPVRLVAKGIDYGVIVADADGDLDTSGVQGIDTDLVVRPFGRKGQFSTVRQFDQDAMMFHFGMQPSEIVGPGVDADGDGVADEILPGELSALEVFITTQDIPRTLTMGRTGLAGFRSFMNTGCGDCHRPQLQTDSTLLDFSFPELPHEPGANVYFTADLSTAPTGFERNARGGLVVRLFGDLKRHDMGEPLSESFQGADAQTNREFMTAELWGVADSGPYLHDGRALTLNAAILAHGGEAQPARDAYDAMTDTQKNLVLAFLRTLRAPLAPNSDVLATR